ncbi:hypothetical protein [Brevundimonas nasdae]|uniref:hypothetical protein n=1 Tax=Brevundimonas nasdae TaxID=172043 RepID=UPI0012ED8D9E|nr:hypothetical protein [Brevundimonas nasdae]
MLKNSCFYPAANVGADERLTDRVADGLKRLISGDDTLIMPGDVEHLSHLLEVSEASLIYDVAMEAENAQPGDERDRALSGLATWVAFLVRGSYPHFVQELIEIYENIGFRMTLTSVTPAQSSDEGAFLR